MNILDFPTEIIQLIISDPICDAVDRSVLRHVSKSMDALVISVVDKRKGVVMRNMNILFSIRKNGWHNASILCAQAALMEYKNIVIYMHEMGYGIDGVAAAGARVGRLDIVKYALSIDKNEYLCANVCVEAARGGYLEILKYARENGCEWDSRVCSEAARRGHLEILKYARENGCPWDSWTCTDAARGSHLEILKYALENGCQLNVFVYSRAAAGEGRLEIIKYAHENGLG